MTRKVKFPLKMPNGAEIRTLKELKNNFDVDSVVGYFNDRRLLSWLYSHYYNAEADRVEKLEKGDPLLNKKLCEIFGVESEVEALDIAKSAWRTERLNRLQHFTDDKKILESVDLVAFDQDDLDNLMEDGESLIYLCNNEFDIQLGKRNKIYIGIGKAIAVIHSGIPVNFDRLNIQFKNVVFDDNYNAILKKRDLIEQQRPTDEESRFPQKLYDEGNTAYESEDYETALKKFKESASLGYTEAFTRIGLFHYFGSGVDADLNKAQYWFKRGIEQNNGNAFGYYAASLLYAFEPTEADKRQAFEYMKRATELEPDDGTWWHELGDMYYEGIGTNKNFTEAFHCYEKAARLGESECLKKLGIMYRNGEYVDENPSKAFEFMKKSAVYGDVQAMYDTGKMYLDGYGIAQDDAKAFRWIKKAAGAEHLAAMYTLARMYREGKGTKKNINEQIDLLNKSAELGLADAMVALGRIYRDGDGVPKDSQVATEYFKKAADAGNSAGMNRLGLMYLLGQGVEKNQKLAFKCFLRSAEEGNATGMAHVGYCYFTGSGILKNLEKASYWLKKSAENENYEGMVYYADFLFKQKNPYALDWYKKAFEKLNSGIIAYKIYKIYKDGLGDMPKDNVRAAHWESKYKSLSYAPDDNNFVTSTVSEMMMSLRKKLF